MTDRSTGGAPAKATVTFERIFEAAIADVWELWTTQAGLESWWGPEGFATRVLRIEVRVGGGLHYAMTATAPEQIGFLEKAGLPITTEQRVIYQAVVPPTHLVYVSRADFIPGVAPYDVTTRVELRAEGAKVRMLVTIDAMHDADWTKMATFGWQSQLGRLAQVLADRPHAALR
ncbi:MAG TPA: SRPBCC domain-containing protein [Polyangia bacterium]|nr:SRPBCC domain-containing protein [Polyangia bacterium]